MQYNYKQHLKFQHLWMSLKVTVLLFVYVHHKRCQSFCVSAFACLWFVCLDVCVLRSVHGSDGDRVHVYKLVHIFIIVFCLLLRSQACGEKTAQKLGVDSGAGAPWSRVGQCYAEQVPPSRRESQRRERERDGG